jgi:hypothetical protein
MDSKEINSILSEDPDNFELIAAWIPALEEAIDFEIKQSQ